jgi:hypothetical protein
MLNRALHVFIAAEYPQGLVYFGSTANLKQPLQTDSYAP